MYPDMKSEWPGIFIKDHIQIGIYRGATYSAIFGSFPGSFSGPKIISKKSLRRKVFFFTNFKVKLEGVEDASWTSDLKT